MSSHMQLMTPMFPTTRSLTRSFRTPFISKPGLLNQSNLPSARLDQRRKPGAVESGVEACRCSLGFHLKIATASLRFGAAPVRQIGVGARRASPHSGGVDGFEETLRQLALGRGAASSDDDLRGNVAPVEDNEFGQGWLFLWLQAARVRNGAIAP